MGTAYTRADTANNIADGNVIDPDVLDAEFDAIQAAMSTSGHTHDGTAGEGGVITKVGPTQDVVISATTVLPKTDATVDLGSASKKFKDLSLSGTASLTKATVNEIQFKASLGTLTSLSGTTPSVDCSLGDFFSLTTSGNTTFTFDYSSITLTTNDTYVMYIFVTAGGSHTLTWPTTLWPEGLTPDPPSSGETDIYAFATSDGGTTWYGVRIGQAFS